MCFINDQRVVFPQGVIAVGFCQQYSVGHHLHKRRVVGAIIEPNFVADRVRARLLQLMREPGRQTARGDAAWLRAADHAVNAATEFEANFRKLRGFAGAGFAAQDNDLIFFNQRGDFFAPLGNRQRVVEGGRRDDGVALHACGELFARSGLRIHQPLICFVMRLARACKFAAFFGECDEPAAVRQQHIVENQSWFGHRARILRGLNVAHCCYR